MIPNTAHLIWLGPELRWLHSLAVQSAALRGGFDRVVLHHDSDLSANEHFAELGALPNVERRPLDWESVLCACGAYGSDLAAVLPRLLAPNVRSDLLRIALLYGEGGVYLDADTVTLRSLAPLRERAEAFVGTERLCYTAGLKGTLNLPGHAVAAVRSTVRSLCRRMPRGWRAFRRIERAFPVAENNAIIGSAAGGRFITAAVEELLQIPPKRQSVTCAIGPDLMQAVAPRFTRPSLEVYPTTAFFPLGPEISEHWFRALVPGTASAELADVLDTETYVVHWYASVRAKRYLREMDPEYVRNHADRQLLSALAMEFAREAIAPGTTLPSAVRVPSPNASRSSPEAGVG